MPQSLLYIGQLAANIAVAATEAITTSEAVAVAVGSTAYFLTEGAIILGAGALLSAATKPKLPATAATMTPLNQTRPSLRWGVGRMRVSGSRNLWDTVPGWAIESNMIHEGKVDGFEQVYLNDDKVTIKDNHFVASFPDGSTNQAYAENLIQIYFRPGRTTEVPTAALVAIAGDKWTTAHRADGVAAIDMMVKAVKDVDVSRCYPNGQPAVSVVTRLSPVYDWRDETQSISDPSTWKWSQNAVVCHLTWEWYGRYLEAARDDNIAPNAAQMRVWTREFLPALTYWTTAADIADELVDLKDSGNEARYSVALMTFSTDQSDTARQDLMKAYDGWMMRRSDGARVVRAGKYVTPTFEVTDANIKSLSWSNGTAKGQMVNILEGSFLSPDNDYTNQPIDPWEEDDETIGAEGEVRDTFDLAMVPTHGQARRLLKREMFRRRAQYTGTLVLDLSGLDIGDYGHRWIRIVRDYGPDSMRNVVVEVTGEVQVDFSKLTVTVPIRSSGANIDEWTPATEEGFKPSFTGDRTIPDILAAPEITDAFAEFQSPTSAMIVVKIADPHDPTRTYQLSYLNGDGAAVDGPWMEASEVTGGLALRAGPVGIGTYVVVIRANMAGRITDWSNPPTEVLVNLADAPYSAPKYEDGVDINDLRPAQPGADVTADHTSADTAHVSGVPAATVISDARTNALSTLQTFLTALGVQDQLRALMFTPGGKNIQLIAIDAKTSTDNMQETLSVIGAVSLDGTSFVFNGSAVKVGDQTLAELLSGIQTSLDGHTASISTQATSIGGLLASWVLNVNNDTGAVTGIKAEAVGTIGHLDFVSGVIRFVTTSTSGDPKVPFIISGDKVVCTVDFEVDGAFIALGSVDTGQVADNAISDAASASFGAVSDLSTEKTVATLTFNPQGKTVELQYKMKVGNPSSTEVSLRAKVYRDGTNISGSLGVKLSLNYETTYLDWVDDTGGGTSDVVYTVTAQTVTGTDIGDTGGTGISRDCDSAVLKAKVLKNDRIRDLQKSEGVGRPARIAHVTTGQSE